MIEQSEPATACSIVDTIDRGDMSAEETMRHCLQQIEVRERDVQAFVDIQPEQALAAAIAADTVPKEQRGPLHGLPVAVKAVFDVAGMRCNWGTKIHQDRIPKTDAVVVQRLKDAGAIIVGTTVSTEYAIADAGPTNNPFDAACTPGGSSSGSAAAVASGMVSVALGSQTVGSIVRPAAYCGIFGLKPTRGAIPKRGGMALSPRLDHPGILARTPGDVRLFCQTLFAKDDEDPDSQAVPPPAQEPALNELRVLCVQDWPPAPVSQASMAALNSAQERLSTAGVTIERATLPDEYNTVIDVLYTIMTRDMAMAHGQDRDRAGDMMSTALRELIDRGRTVTENDYDQAVGIADRWRDELMDQLGANTVMLSTAVEGIAPPRTAGTGSNRQQALWSLVGLPVMAIPTGLQGHLPIGIQIGAGHAQEASLIAAASAIQAGRLDGI